MNSLFPAWYEFLLDSEKLEKHLTSKQAPSGPELIVQFLQHADSISNTEEAEQGGAAGKDKKKVVFLRLLALKIGSILKWDLGLLCDELPVAVQFQLLSELLKAVDLVPDILELGQLDLVSLSGGQVFVLTVFFRWCLRTHVTQDFPGKPVKNAPVAVPGLTDPMFLAQHNLTSGSAGPVIAQVSERLPELVATLRAVGEWETPIPLLSPPCITLPSPEPIATSNGVGDGAIMAAPLSDDAGIVWERATAVPSWEHSALISYDLGMLCFHQEQYMEALGEFSRAMCLLEQAPAPPLYCALDVGRMSGYLHALSGVLAQPSPVADDSDLTHKVELIAADLSKSSELPGLLEAAGPLRIPSQLVDMLQERLAGGPVGQVMQVFGLAQRVVLGHSCLATSNSLLDHCSAREIAYFVKMLSLGVQQGSSDAAKNVSVFIRLARQTLPHISPLWEELRQSEISTLVPIPATTTCTADDDQEAILSPVSFDTPHYEDHVGPSVTSLLWKLMTSGSGGELPGLVERLQALNYTPAHLQLMCKAWSVPPMLVKALTAEEPTIANVVCYLLVAKARHCLRLENYSGALSLLSEAHSLASARVRDLIRSEQLHVELRQVSGENRQGQLLQALVNRAKTCITSLSAKDGLVPAKDAVVACLAFLLNQREGVFINLQAGLQNAYPHLLLCRQLVAVVKELLQNASKARPHAKTLIDTVMLVFNRGAQLKSGRASGEVQLGPVSRHELSAFLTQITDPMLLSLMISLLSKLCMATLEEAFSEIHSDYAALWPTVLASSSNYLSHFSVRVALMGLLEHALAVDPANVSWLKTKADCLMASSQSAAALRCLMQAGAAETDFFSRPVPPSVFSDQVYRKIMKLLSILHCHTQVAVLCQYLEEPDYALAFKVLQQRPLADAGDALYWAFWDSAILEYIVFLHSKNAEQEKEQVALTHLSCLELNGNNPEDILQEAARVRKQRFMRTLAKQYL